MYELTSMFFNLHVFHSFHLIGYYPMDSTIVAFEKATFELVQFVTRSELFRPVYLPFARYPVSYPLNEIQILESRAFSTGRGKATKKVICL